MRNSLMAICRHSRRVALTDNAEKPRPDLYLRDGPDGKPLAGLYIGDEVVVLGWIGYWALVDTRKGRGWVDGRYFR